MDIDLDTVRREWRRHGFSCAIWTDPPGQVWPDFVHVSDERVMLLAGAITLQFSGQTLTPDIGATVLIPAGVAHTVINSGATTNRWLYGYASD